MGLCIMQAAAIHKPWNIVWLSNVDIHHFPSHDISEIKLRLALLAFRDAARDGGWKLGRLARVSCNYISARLQLKTWDCFGSRPVNHRNVSKITCP